MMSGDITVQSEPGAGSIFTCELPLPEVEAAVQEHKDPRRIRLADSIEALPGAGICVLLVEDNPVNQKLGRRMLERLGCGVESAQNGQQALSLLSLRRYDIVFMDCQMPVMDGYTAVAELRRRETDQRRTLVVALTAHAMQGAREQCLESGMDDYLSKPFSLGDLRAMLHKYPFDTSSDPHLAVPAAPPVVGTQSCKRPPRTSNPVGNLFGCALEFSNAPPIEKRPAAERETTAGSSGTHAGC